MTVAKIGNLGNGGAGENSGTRSGEDATQQELLLAVRAELDDLRAKYLLVLAKLDADAGVTDTDYAALGAPAAATFSA